MTALDPNASAVPTLSSLQADEIADYCLRAVGPTRVWLVGATLSALLAPLRAAGCDVAVHQDIPTDFAASGTVIAWADPGTQSRLLHARNANALVLVMAAGTAEQSHVTSEQASSAGWQQHPAMFVLPAIHNGISIQLLARAGVCAADRQSMLRAGYHGLAAALVRPGDVVLAADAADHGLWRILQQQSRCRSLQVLSAAPVPAALEPGITWHAPDDGRPDALSADVLVTRIDLDDGAWLQELRVATAALVRSGRLIVAVPLNADGDVGGGDLLFTLETLGLLVDRAWWQNLSRPVGSDQFIEAARDGSGRLLIDTDARKQADALVIMAVKTVGDGVAPDPELQVPNIIAFQRDYLDASVVRLIVAMGLRLESAPLRRHLAEQLLHALPIDSADYGAALCVLLYDPAAVEGARRTALLEASLRYIGLTPANPTVLRWQVSLTYAAGALHHAAGDLEQAADLYARVLAFDVLAFSPLLGTKTTAAAARLGWILFGRGEIAAARQAWLQGLTEARRLASHADWSEVVGDIEFPETFGMPEFAAVMDEAGRLASALRVTAEAPLRPGLAWQWGNQSLQSRLSRAHDELQRCLAWQEQLHDAKDWLDRQYHQLNAEIDRRAASLQVLESANAALAQGNAALTADNADLRLRLQHEQAQLSCLADEHARLVDQHARLEGEHARLIAAAQELSTATSGIMPRVAQSHLPGESIADQLDRLSIALRRIPLKPAVRFALRLLVLALGSRKRP